MHVTHYVNFSSDARSAICGWTPPEDYAGTTVYLSSATCPACIAAIQRQIDQLHDVGDRLAGGRPVAAQASLAEHVSLVGVVLEQDQARRPVRAHDRTAHAAR